MKKIEKCVFFVEVYKYPYCVRPNKNEDYLSAKICCCTIKTGKKIIKKAKLLIFYGNFILRLTTGVPYHVILLPQPQLIMKSIHSNIGFSKKAIIA